MPARLARAIVLTGLIASAIGCSKPIDRAAFKSAINRSYDGQHLCVWPEPTKLPVLVDPTKDDRVRGFEALTDAGLFLREFVEKKDATGFIKINRYNLTDKGHAAWTSDPGHPDSGNFCFGRFNITAIDKASPNDASDPTQYTVDYSYEVEGIPGWARTPESMRAFPKIAANTSIQSATATLVKAADGAWSVPPQTAH